MNTRKIRSAHLLRILPAAGAAVIIALAGASLAGCSSARADGVIRVPEEVATLTEAVDTAEPGDMILLGAGTYNESVTVETPDITIRGADRNKTVIDGEGVRPYGIVSIADGVRVENLTVTGHTFYGVLITGVHDKTGFTARGLDGYEPFDPAKFPPVERFSVEYVTASNNGLYGIYAFNAQHGTISSTYTSGSADSGLYVGQCRECNILVEDNIAERNAVGFENANASDSVVVVGNRFTRNRVGLTLTSNYQEALHPQKKNLVAGNLIAGNQDAQSPAQAQGGFGIGIGIAGGLDNELVDNRVADNELAGLILTNTEDLPSERNIVTGFFENNGVDVVNDSAERSPARGNCVAAETAAGAELTTLPEGGGWIIENDCADSDAEQQQPSALGKGGASRGFLGSTAAPSAGAAGGTGGPPGMSYLKVPAPPAQQGMDDPEAKPTGRVGKVKLPSRDDYETPDASLLAEWALR